MKGNLELEEEMNQALQELHSRAMVLVNWTPSGSTDSAELVQASPAFFKLTGNKPSDLGNLTLTLGGHLTPKDQEELLLAFQRKKAVQVTFAVEQRQLFLFLYPLRTLEGSQTQFLAIYQDAAEARENLETIGRAVRSHSSSSSLAPTASPNGRVFMSSVRPKLSISVTFDDLHYGIEQEEVIDPTDPKSKKEKRKRTILDKLTGEVLPGEVCAIMGPTGCGKTTLLNLIAGNVTDFEGSVRFNGKERTKAVKRYIAYVRQEDVLFAWLSVRETFEISANLRLQKDCNEEERMQRVEEMIATLNLTKCQNTNIGNAFVRGISGGERKRTYIGKEMLTNPSILLLDEPTTGLDSSTSLSLIGTLKQFAAGGRTVITTLHQPSSQMFEQFDKLLLLVDGRIVYFGKARDSVAYFSRLGLTCPITYNPADYFMMVIQSEDLQQLNKGMKKKLIERYENHFELNRHAICTFQPTGNETGVNELPKYGSTWLQQFRILARRNMSQRWRQLDYMSFLQIIVSSIILGILWLQMAREEGKIFDRVGVIFFCCVFVGGFHPILNALTTFLPEKNVIMTERSGGWYQFTAYFFSKVLTEPVFDLPFPFLMSVIVYWMAGLQDNVNFIYFTLILFLSNFTAAGLGLFVASLVPIFPLAMTLAIVVMQACMLTGGFFIKPEGMPVWFRWVRFLSFIKYSYEAEVQLEFRGTEFKPINGTIYPLDSNGMIDGGYLADNSLGVELPIWSDLLILFGFAIFFRLCCYIRLR